MNSLAQGMLLRELDPNVGQTAEFDASRVYENEPVDLNQIYNAIGKRRDDVEALGILLAQSKQELQESVYYCNQKAWGYWDTDVGAPTPAQAAAMIERMDTRFAQHAWAAHKLRAICQAVSDAFEKAKAQLFEDLQARR